MKLCIETSKIFSCAPKRLLYSEKEKLQKVLFTFLKEGNHQSFSYFRRFIKDFSTLAKKGLNCFSTLKKKLMQAPVSAIYNFKDEIEL